MPGRTGTLRGPGRYPPGHALARSERNRKTMGHRRHARLEGRAQRLDNAMVRGTAVLRLAGIARLQNARASTSVQDRTSVVWGKSGSVRLVLGCCRFGKKKN